MALDIKQVEKELDDLERSIGLLKREFEIFFAGAAKQPPLNTRDRLDGTFKRFAAKQGLSYALRFRYNTLVGRFNSYNELWNKQLRLKEEGRTSEVKPKHHRPAPPPEAKIARETRVEKIFQEYISAREKTGETGALNFQSFSQTIAKQREALVGKYKCKDVDFYVTVEQGRTKLKARVIK